MELFITADFNRESGLDKITNEIYYAGYDKYFPLKNYGTGLLGLSVCFMCRNPASNFKRRIRFVKKEKKLYMDVMLDLNEMIALSHQARRRLVIQQFVKAVPEVMSKYKLVDFDHERFFDDLRSWVEGLGWY